MKALAPSEADLVERYMPLARKLARRYGYASEPLEDLIQVAYVGLLKAARRFDHELGYQFSSYATPMIVGELRRHFRDKCWAVRVPRAAQERSFALKRECKRMAAELGRSPSVSELAVRLRCSAEDVREAERVARAYDAVSLDDRGGPRAESTARAFAEQVGADDPGYEVAEAMATIAPIWRALPERERRILRLHFANDLSQREIGALVGCSQGHIGRLIRRALDRLSVVAEVDARGSPGGGVRGAR